LNVLSATLSENHHSEAMRFSAINIRIKAPVDQPDATS